MLVPHPLDLVAILLGIFLAIRRSEVRVEEPGNHPGVSAADFATWKARAMFAYTVGVRACFGKVFLDFAYLALLKRVTLDLTVQRVIGATLDLGWVVLMITGWVLSRRASRFARDVGMRLGARPAEREPEAQNPEP